MLKKVGLKKAGRTFGPELATNGTFNTDVTGWSSYRGTLSWIADGWARITADGLGSSQLNRTYVNLGGRWVTVSVDFRNRTGGNIARLNALNASSGFSTIATSGNTTTTSGYLTITCFIPAGASVQFTAEQVAPVNAGDYIEWDNFSIRELRT